MVEKMVCVDGVIWVIHQHLHSLNPQMRELVFRHKLPASPNRILQFAVDIRWPKNIHHPAEVPSSTH